MTVPQHYDVVILGTGPAGLQAAIHAARKKVSVMVLGKENKSSLFHAHIENFCCLFNVAGDQMLANGRKQAAGFGAQFSEDDVLAIQSRDDLWVLETEGVTLVTPVVIIATGTHRNRLGVKGEKDFIGKGVSYCVDCDGHFYAGENVAVVGNESAAVDGALTLVDIGAKDVHLVCERLEVSAALKSKLEASPIKVHLAKIKAILGTDQVQGVALSNDASIPVSGVFIEQGAKGLLQLATNLGVMLDDEMRYIRTDKQQATNVPGIYAAGDVCGPPWQMAKAVGEGCVAGIYAADYAKKRKQ